MGKKKGKSGSGDGNVNEMLTKPEERMQGLILADSFDLRFRPVTFEKPRALLPLCNAPLLAYAIEFLAAAKVEEIIVFCTSHADQVRDYVESCVWSQPHSGVTVETVISPDCLSAGDALREVDARGLLRDDFVLMSGDVVANIDLASVIERHRERVKKDKSNVMTMVFKQAAPTHRTRSPEDDTVLALSAANQILQFDRDLDASATEVPTSMLKEHGPVQLRYDLIDTHIDICTKEVLFLFTDNFDWQDLRQDFVKGVLESEILGERIFADIATSSYAARVRDLRTYNSVSQDILDRWSFPMVPDGNWWLPSAQLSYSLSRQHIYMERNVNLHWNAVVGQRTIVGANTVVGDSAQIRRSTVGNNCTIGAHSIVENSFIWDNVRIGDHCHVVNSIISESCVLSSGSASISSILGPSVGLGRNFMAKSLKLTKLNPSDLESDDDDEGDYKIDHLDTADGFSCFSYTESAESNGFVKWNKLSSSFEPSISSLEQAASIGARARARVSTSSANRGQLAAELFAPWQQQDEFSASRDESDDAEDLPPLRIREFNREVQATVHKRVADKTSMENIDLEIKSLRFASNASPLECARALLAALHSVPAPAQSRKKTVFSMFKRFSKMLSSFVETEADQVDLVYALQEACEDDASGQLADLFEALLSSLYHLDVVEEQAIREWAADQAESTDKSFLRRCAKFLAWLDEAEEEDSDEE